MRGLVASVLGLMLMLPGVAPAGNLLVSWRVNGQQETSRDEAGLRQGEVVSLMLPNAPEFVIAWMGVAKLGAIMAQPAPWKAWQMVLSGLPDYKQS